jgi:hypothetical protein
MITAKFGDGVRRLAWVDRVLLRLNRRAGAVTIVWVALGLGLLAVSMALGIAVFPFDGRLVDGGQISGFVRPKDVGYASALNVSLVSTVLLPALLFTLVRARSAMERLAETLVKSGMVRSRTKPFDPCDKEEFLAAWRKHMGVSAAFGVFFTLLGAGVMIHDFYDVVMRPLMAEEPIYEICPGLKFAADYPCNLFNTSIDLDWSISALYPDGPSSRVATGVFAGFVYLLAPIAGAAIAFFSFIQFVFFGSFYSRPSLETMGIAITPRPGAENPSAGFEHFTETFICISWSALLVVMILYLGHMQNIYWRVPAASTIIEFYGFAKLASLTSFDAIWNFFTEDVARIWSVGPSELLKTRQSVFAVILVPFVFLTPLVFGYLVLFDTALQGRGLMRDLPETRNSTRKHAEKTKPVSPWPIIWTGLSCIWLLIILMVAIASFVWPRLFFIVFILSSIMALQNARRLLKKPANAG